MRNIEPEQCEVGCEASEAGGLGLCMRHLDEWLRSPERRMLPQGFSEEQWSSQLDQFITRKRQPASLRAGVTSWN